MRSSSVPVLAQGVKVVFCELRPKSAFSEVGLIRCSRGSCLGDPEMVHAARAHMEETFESGKLEPEGR